MDNFEAQKAQNQQRAERALQAFLDQNQANEFAGIDRSAQAVAQRMANVNWSNGNDALEGYERPEADSLLARQQAHYVHGRISAEQAQAVTDIMIGLR